jgi:hypothetical protein
LQWTFASIFENSSTYIFNFSEVGRFLIQHLSNILLVDPGTLLLTWCTSKVSASCVICQVRKCCDIPSSIPNSNPFTTEKCSLVRNLIQKQPCWNSTLKDHFTTQSSVMHFFLMLCDLM